MMVGSICLQFGMALTSMSICLPHLIAVSLSFGAPPALVSTSLLAIFPLLPPVTADALVQTLRKLLLCLIVVLDIIPSACVMDTIELITLSRTKY